MIEENDIDMKLIGGSKNIPTELYFPIFFIQHNPKLHKTQTHTHTPTLLFSPLCGLAQAAWQLLSVYVLVFKLRMIGGRPSPQRAASAEPG